ncbi:MAG: RNA polymerase sigma factor [Pseudomonadota bacterium]
MCDPIANNPQIRPEHLQAVHDDLWRWVQSHTHDRSQTDDVIQDVYVLILEGRARFREDSTLKTWLFGVAYNVWRDTRRRHARRSSQATDTTVLHKISDEEPAYPDPAGRDGEDRRADIDRALQHLSLRQREILTLSIYRDFTLEECARILGIRLGSVRTHFHRAKQALRKHLGEHDA